MLTRFGFVVAAAALTLSIGCGESATKDKPVARGSEAVTASSAAAPAAGATSYTFSNAGSKIEFVGAKVTGKHDGSFGVFSGTISTPADPTKGTVSVKIDMSSMTTDSEKLTGHLKSAEFFDVAKIPEAKFTSTAIKAGGDKGASHTVTGNLDLHGVSKSISFPANIKVTDSGVEVSAEFGINRKDFNITYPGKPDDLIKDEVLLKLNIKASKG
ncbi:MAG: YceI family protein [Polyangiaceae bacterium]